MDTCTQTNRPSLPLSGYHNLNSTGVDVPSFIHHQKQTLATCSETSFLILSVCGFEKILAGSFIQRSYFSLAVKVVGAQYVSTGDSDRVPQSGCRARG
jgi:hypothetical protein